MADTHETPAGHARLLHQQVKAFRAELAQGGYNRETAYRMLLSVMMRVAYEDDGDAGIAALLTILRDET